MRGSIVAPRRGGSGGRDQSPCRRIEDTRERAAPPGGPSNRETHPLGRLARLAEGAEAQFAGVHRRDPGQP